MIPPVTTADRPKEEEGRPRAEEAPGGGRTCGNPGAVNELNSGKCRKLLQSYKIVVFVKLALGCKIVPKKLFPLVTCRMQV